MHLLERGSGKKVVRRTLIRRGGKGMVVYNFAEYVKMCRRKIKELDTLGVSYEFGLYFVIGKYCLYMSCMLLYKSSSLGSTMLLLL